jgi:hypothetical protein
MRSVSRGRRGRRFFCCACACNAWTRGGIRLCLTALLPPLLVPVLPAAWGTCSLTLDSLTHARVVTRASCLGKGRHLPRPGVLQRFSVSMACCARRPSDCWWPQLRSRDHRLVAGSARHAAPRVWCLQHGGTVVRACRVVERMERTGADLACRRVVPDLPARRLWPCCASAGAHSSRLCAQRMWRRERRPCRRFGAKRNAGQVDDVWKETDASRGSALAASRRDREGGGCSGGDAHPRVVRGRCVVRGRKSASRH